MTEWHTEISVLVVCKYSTNTIVQVHVLTILDHPWSLASLYDRPHGAIESVLPVLLLLLLLLTFNVHVPFVL